VRTGEEAGDRASDLAVVGGVVVDLAVAEATGLAVLGPGEHGGWEGGGGGDVVEEGRRREGDLEI
jgi:hypothetical protein